MSVLWTIDNYNTTHRCLLTESLVDSSRLLCYLPLKVCIYYLYHSPKYFRLNHWRYFRPHWSVSASERRLIEHSQLLLGVWYNIDAIRANSRERFSSASCDQYVDSIWINCVEKKLVLLLLLDLTNTSIRSVAPKFFCPSHFQIPVLHRAMQVFNGRTNI